jgi:hypothetical protein
MVSMKNMMDVYIYVIIITKSYVVSTIAFVIVYAYSNIPRFSFLERSLDKVQLLVLILESLIDFYL